MGEKRAQRYEVAMSAIRITRELVGVENGMAASRILEAMKSQNQPVTTKPATVRNVLADLKEDYDWGGKIRSLERERGESTYNYKYYFEPYVSQEELQWIIDDIRTSRLHSPETGERLVEGVKKLLPESMGRKTGAAKVFVSQDALIDEHTEKNIEFIKNVIHFNRSARDSEKRVCFIMKGHGTGGRMNTVTDQEGYVRQYEILPLALTQMDNKCYMLGYKENSRNVSIHRIDLMYDMKEKVCKDVAEDDRKDSARNQTVDSVLSRFVSQHGYASYGEKHTYIVRAKAINGAFTYVRDFAGSDVELSSVKGKPDEAEFVYICPQRTMEILLRQYIGLLKVTGPEQEKEAVEKALIDSVLSDEGYRKQLIERLMQR